MANITNGSKKVDRRKDLWAHVSFGELYAYNPPIAELTALSKKVINQYLAVATGDKMPGVTKLSDGAFICGGPNSIPRVTTAIENYRNEPSEDTPKEILFTTMEILDAFNVVPTPAAIKESFERLQAYITLGLYPLIAEPMGESDLTATFEKYDSVSEGRRIIGTIVDTKIVEEMEETTRQHLVATIMWEPEFAMTTTPELLISYAGVLMLRDMIATPNCWVSQDADPVFTNNGVPVYEFTPTTATIAGLSYAYTGLGYVNEALVTGTIKLDFIDHLLANMHEANNELQNLIRQRAAKGAVVVQTPSEEEDDDEDEEDGTLEDGAIFEDASKDFARRLHLYDRPFEPTAWEDDEDTLIL